MRNNLAIAGKMIATLMVILVTVCGWARSPRTVFMSVEYIDTSGKPMIVVVCRSPFASLLEKMQTAELRTPYDKDDDEASDKPLGGASFMNGNDSLAGFAVMPNAFGAARGIRIGDLVKVDVTDTLHYPLHLTSQLLGYNLELRDQNKEQFFSNTGLNERYLKDPEGTDRWLIDILYHDTRDFYARYKDVLTDETFTRPIEKGRYSGKNMLQVFDALSKQDIEDFLWFMVSFPSKYIGVPYKFNETFATWVVSDAPSGGMEILKLYDACKGDGIAFEKALRSRPWLLNEKDLSQNIALCANHLGYWNDTIAEKYFQATIAHSMISGDMAGAGLSYLFIAENYQNKEMFERTLYYCARALDIYEKQGNPDRLFDLYFKRSYVYYTTSAYDSSFLSLAQAKKILETPGLQLEDYTQEKATAKYHDYMGFTYYKAGRYLEALAHIDSAIATRTAEQELKDPKGLAFNYKLKGLIFNGQSLYDKALDAYERSADMYKSAGDLKTYAETRTDVSIALFNQGKYRESNELLSKTIKSFENYNDLNNIGFCYSQIGQNYWNLGMYDSAITSHRTAIDFRRRSGNRTGQAFSWEQLGTLYQKAGIKPLALAALDTAAALYESLNSRKELAEILLEAGKVYKNDKETDKAENYYRRAADQLAQLGNQAGYADALFELGSMLMADKPAEAEIYMDSCRILSLRTGKRSDAAYAMMNLGALLKSRGKIAEGKQWYLEAKNIVSTLNDNHAMAYYHRSLGRDAEWELDLDSANRCYQRAILIFDSTHKARALELKGSMAYNYQNMGLYDEAEKLLDKVIQEARASNLLLELAAAFHSKAWMLLQQGQTEQGLALADSASLYYEQTGNKNSLAGLYGLLGDLDRKQFNYTAAFRSYTRADSIYALSNDPWRHSSALLNFMVLYYYQGDYQRSLDYTLKALQLRPFLLEDQTYLDIQSALAEIYYYLGKTDSSRYFINKYLPLTRAKKLKRSENWLSLIMGRMLVDEKKYAEAVTYLKGGTGPESAKHDLNIYQQALAFLGMAYSGVGKADSAEHYFQLAANTATTFEIPSFSWEALYLAGLDAYEHGAYEKAIPLFKQSVALVNKQASNLYGGEEAGKLFRQQPAKADLYYKLMAALTKTGRKDEAWQYANLAQAAAISDLAGGLSAEMEHPEKQKALLEAQAKFQQIQTVGQAIQESKKDSVTRSGQIAVLEKRRAIAEEEYLNYIEQLKKDYPELGTFFANQVNPENFRNLHGYLPEDMAMIMYVINDNELMIFWATQENTGIVTGTIPADFYKTTEAWLTALKNPQRPANAGPLVLRTQIGRTPSKAKPTMDVKTGAQMLYNILIEPLLAEINEKSSWCIIPNGRLTHLPFHAMGTTNAQGNFEYIAASKDIFYTNKPNEMFLPWNRRNKQNFAAFGNPDGTLQSAGDEARQIAKALNTTNVYTEEGATIQLASQSLSNMHYVHFATHGVLSYPDLDSSYLVFAPGADQPNGGKLTLYDVRRLNIKGCDLVTLSACETAVSAEVAKGWYISPANAFLINRVRSVVASLWEVDDESTNLLMQHFYRHLQTHPKAEALRMAMADISAMPQFEHPFYWAAFVLYGDRQ
ncbi:MAG TPA: CHAT domain-containing protein [Phnomibacter sp.]|nr:CHAT domain-containing protein [Phnomibacter sp.]